MKILVRFMLMVFASLFVQLSASAQTTQSNTWSASAGTVIMSEYYGTIFGGTFYEGPMSFTDITFSRENVLGTFSITPTIGRKLDRVNTFNIDGGDEEILAVSQTAHAGPVLLYGSVYHDAVTDLNEIKGDFLAQTLRVDLPLGIVQPYIQAFHYFKYDGGLDDDGWIGYAGLIRDQELAGLKFNFDYRLGINGGALGGKTGVEYHRLTVGLPISFGQWTVTPAVVGQLEASSHDQTWVTEDKLMATVSVRYRF